MKSILCIGSGNELADRRAQAISLKNKLFYKGLLNHENPEEGCYHTSLVDIDRGILPSVAKKFNAVVFLNQSISDYETIEDYWLTTSLVNDLKSSMDVIFENQDQNYTTFDDLKSNPAMCVLPFIGYRKEGTKVSPCCYYDLTRDFTDDADFNFYTNTEFQRMRESTRTGIIDPGCRYCVKVESHNVSSPRQMWSKEWLIKLGINNRSKLTPSESFYDIRLGNKCNLMCRTCVPRYSILIDREYYELGLTHSKSGALAYNDFSSINLETVKHVYVAGGEPTIDRGFVKFLESCVEVGKTDFELVINTNAASPLPKFLSLIERFSKVKFEISVDGFGSVNQYIRWPVVWDKLVSNIKTLSILSHNKVSFNTVASILSVGNLYDCFKFLDTEYPAAEKHVAYNFHPEHLQPWKFPDKSIAMDDLRKIHGLNCFTTQESFRSKILGLEEMIQQYTIDVTETQSFFDWNDKLDQSRNIRLVDFIPSLEKCRPQ